MDVALALLAKPGNIIAVNKTIPMYLTKCFEIA
jgi:hypothetical protein